jgi:hypothetical protein
VPKADKLAWLPGVLRGGSGGFCACGWDLVLGFIPRLLIDIVKRERETQAARVLAGPGVTWGHRNNDRLASFKRIAKKLWSQDQSHMASRQNVRNAIMLMDHKSIGELFQT